MPNWKKVIVSGSDAHLKTLNITNDTASSTVFSVDGTSGRLFSVTDELSGSLFAVSDISGIPSFEVFSDDIVNIGTHNSEGIIVSGSAVKFPYLVADTSETKSLMINSDGVIITRDLSAGAFSSGTGTMSSWTIKEGNGSESTSVTNGETLTIAQGTGIESELTSTTSGGTITITNTAPMTGDTFDNDGTYASLRAQGTTAGDVGLGNVTNESKATMFSSPTFTGTVSGVTKSHVGLGNVENTALSTYTGEEGSLDNQYITNGAGYITSFTNTMGSGFVLEDGDGTEVTITENKEVKFVEGESIDINWTDTSNGTDGDPYDLTFSLKTAGVGAGTYGSTANGTKIDTITVDAYGRVTAVGTGATGTSTFDGAYSSLTGTPTIPTNNNELDNGAGYITSADGGNADTVDSLHASSFIRSDANDTATGIISFTNTTDSTSVTTGAVKISGGLAVQKAMSVATNITASGTIYSADKTYGMESYISRDSYLERGLNFGNLSEDTTATKALVLDGSNNTKYRTLGNNAFNSTAIPTSISDFGEALNEAFTLSSTNLSEFNNDLASGVTGTGVANRIARWSGTSTISSVSDLTFDGVTLVAGVDGATGGRVRTGDGSVSNPAFSFVGDTDTGFYCSTTNTIAASCAGTQRLTINSNGMKINNGALGVNVNASTTDGRIDASNDIVAYSTSDKRLKENVKPIENALDKVSKIGGYEFDWKELSEEEVKTIHGNEGHDVGVIAQEIEKVLPEVVTERDSGYKAVKYEKIVPLLIESIKELKAEIEELKGRL